MHLRSIRLSWSLLLVALPVAARADVVIPSNAATQEGTNSASFPVNNPSPNGNLSVQHLYLQSEMPGLNVGAIITGIRLRLNDNQTTYSTSPWPQFDIYLGGTNSSTLTTTYSANYDLLKPRVQVRSGGITFPSGFFPTTGPPPTGSPRGWSDVIAFNIAPYVYTGGNLIIETRTISPSLPAGVPSLVIDALDTGQTLTQNMVTLNDATTDTAGIGPRTRAWAITLVTAVPETSGWVLLSAASLMAVVCGGARHMLPKSGVSSK